MKSKILRKILPIFLVLLLIGTTLPFQVFASTDKAIKINSQTLFEASTLDTLKLNIKTLPTITVTGSEKYKINNSSKTRPVYNDEVLNSNVIFDCGFDKKLDATVNVSFSNCGTLNSKAIDMKLTYSDIYSAPKQNITGYDTKTFWWTAYGTPTQQTNSNEWFEVGFSRYNVNIQFYYHNSNTPIKLENAYLTLYSEDASRDDNDKVIYSEASSAVGTASNVYLYEGTSIAYSPSLTHSKKAYKDVYYGTRSGSTNAKTKNAISYQYKNKNSINLDMMMLYSYKTMGYHFNFIPFTASIPDNPIKSVSKEQATSKTEIQYTIKQDMPIAYDKSFKLKSLKLADILEKDLEYVSASVFDEKGKDLTTTVGTLSYDKNTKKVMFEFNSNYLNSINYNGQTLSMKVIAITKEDTSSREITNKSISNFNDSEILYSNTVQTDIYYPVTVNYLDELGNKLVESNTNNYFIGDDYTTEEKAIENYELVAVPDNAKGKIINSSVTVNYIYKLKDTSVVVNYIDTEGNNLADSININGKINDNYTTENKSFYGYELIEVPINANGTMSKDIITVNYIYKLKDAKVIVNYIDTENNKLTDSISIEGKVFDKYNTENKSFYGYVLVDLPQNATGEMAEDVITVNYIYARNKNTVTINYLEKETNKKLSDSEVITYSQGDSYNVADKLNKDIKYYSIDNVNGDEAEGIIDNNKIINVYYTRNTNNIIINFIDWITKEVISPIFNRTQDQGTDYNVTDEATKDIPYYTYYDSEGNTYGVLLADETINSYYIRNENTITIKYVDKLTKKSLAEDITITTYQGTNYDVTKQANKEIACYNLDSIEGLTKGFITKDVEIIVYYTTKDTSVIVNYKDTEGNKLTDSISIDGKVFDKYDTENKTFYGYELIEVPTNASGEMTEDVITVDYIYRLKDTSIVANYLDEAGNKLTESITTEGKVFDKYDTENKSFYGYELIEVPSNAKGEMTEDVITVDYIYRLKDTSIVANYLDEVGNKLTESITTEGKVFDKYDTENKTFYGYELIEVPSNAKGEMTEDVITVDYIYRLKDTSIVVNYIDESGNKLTESITTEGKVFDKYDTENKTFYGYELIEVPSNAKGEMTEDVITVDYIYRLKDTSIVANYLDEAGNKLTESITTEGKVFDEYDTENKTFYGYELIEVPANAKGEMTEDVIVIDYIYKLKNGSVIVKYVDEKGKELIDNTLIEGKVFDKYNTSAANIKGYSLKVTPTNTTGEITENVIEVIYIYSQDKVSEPTSNIPNKEVTITPYTGDTNRVGMYITMAVLLVVFIVIMVVLDKHFKNKKNK